MGGRVSISTEGNQPASVRRQLYEKLPLSNDKKVFSALGVLSTGFRDISQALDSGKQYEPVTKMDVSGKLPLQCNLSRASAFFDTCEE